MTRDVQILRLSGLDAGEAGSAARSLLADRSVADLSRLLVLDDAATLLEHAATFENLLNSRRLRHLVCIAIGPPARSRQPIFVPGAISSGQGSAVLWVSDPLGVDWPLSAAAVALVRPASASSGLNQLIEILSEGDVFNRVRELVVDLPRGVANPGLRLAGASDETASFPAALTAAIRRQIRTPAGSAGLEPLISADEARSGETRLAERGTLSLARDGCIAAADDADAALQETARIGSLPVARQRVASARGQVVAAGEALRADRDQVRDLLEKAHAPDGLSDHQRQLVSAAGVEVTSDPPAEPPGGDPAATRDRGVLARAVARRIRAGDPLPLVIDRLTLTERRLTPKGSRAYLAEIDRHCPPSLVDQLTEPPPLPQLQPWLPAAGALAAALAALAGRAGIIGGLIIVLAWTGILALTADRQPGPAASAARRALAANALAGVVGTAAGAGTGLALKPAGPAVWSALVLAVVIVAVAAAASWQARAAAWRDTLAPGRASGAARELTALVARVAAAEWSADLTVLNAIARTRISVQGIQDQLRQAADDAGRDQRGQAATAATAGQPGQPAESQLSEALLPTLQQLALTVLGARPSQGPSDGQAAYRQAQARTGELIGVWTAVAKERGPLARPPFAVPDEQASPVAAEEELAEISATAAYDPYAVMWQLCAPAELNLLDTGVRPGVVAFAPLIAREQLNRVLPSTTVWTSSGQRAGLLRLVPLRAGSVEVAWSGDGREESFG